MPFETNKVVDVSLREASLKRKIRRHLRSLGYSKSEKGELVAPIGGKEIIRSLHSGQRQERLFSNKEFLETRLSKLLKYFANGAEVEPEKITPVLERVKAGTVKGELFRLASLTWSVPVSNGFGRRLRYLVWDKNNGKLIGIIAIGDPVFNLSVRDKLIGWNADDRALRLVNLMDAYVLGAVPPYNKLLGGKLVASLLKSRELYQDFQRIYGGSEGLISGSKKSARLLAITTSSSMGRSSVYNRLKLDDTNYLKSIGYTGGWGHFHIPESLFDELRAYLKETNHKYSDGYNFGNGPNWKMRVTRAALRELGFKEDMLKHGIKREVFICELANNAMEILRTGLGKPDIGDLLSTKQISLLALQRWIIPRSERMPEYIEWNTDKIVDLITQNYLSDSANVDQEGADEGVLKRT